MGKETENKKTILHEISKDDLKKILANHSLWLSSRGAEGQPVNLEGHNLRGAVLVGIDLKKANLKGIGSGVR